MSDSSDDLPVFTVPRSKWYRGVGAFGSTLLREDGCRCCLGHIGSQCGIPDSDLAGQPTPDCADSELWPASLRNRSGCSDVCSQMIWTNDNHHVSDPDRELQLQALAIKAGFQLVFVDDEVTNG